MNEFNAAVSVPAGTHITDNSMAGQNRTKINLVWSDGKWTAADAPAKYHVLCSLQPVEPTTPGEGDLENIEKLVRIVCDRNIHDAKEYGVIAGSCEFGGIDMTGDVPTCPVTIRAAKYVEAYNGTIGVEHTITGDTERLLILAWDANNNVWRPMTDTPVTFTVVCPPAKPGAEDLAKLEAPVEVACTTKPETHAAARFSLIEGTYDIGDVSGNETDGYTCDIIITADEYVTKYNTDFGKHTLTGDNTKPLTLKYVEGRWVVNDPVTFPVKCEEELVPVHLVIYRNGNTKTAYKDVALESQPKGHVIDLSTIDIADYYTGNYEFYGWYDDGLFNIYKSDPANPPAGLKEKTVNGWTNLKCMVYDKYQVVYFQSEEALRDFQNDHSKTEGRLYSTTALFGSTLPTADAPTPTRTGYTFKFWSREGQNGDVTGQTVNGWTNLYAVWEKNTYTVTYTDGVNGEAFADQAYTAKYEDATPAFEGTPARAGYKFLGWEPTVAETVTENATYVAQWEKLYTVTYTDGVDGAAFADQTYTVKEGDATPAFDGTPTREGYVFLGWEPEVAGTVTANATYTAKWEEALTEVKVTSSISEGALLYLGSEFKVTATANTDAKLTFNFEANPAFKQIASDATGNSKTVWYRVVKITGNYTKINVSVTGTKGNQEPVTGTLSFGVNLRNRIHVTIKNTAGEIISNVTNIKLNHKYPQWNTCPALKYDAAKQEYVMKNPWDLSSQEFVSVTFDYEGDTYETKVTKDDRNLFDVIRAGEEEIYVEYIVVDPICVTVEVNGDEVKNEKFKGNAGEKLNYSAPYWDVMDQIRAEGKMATVQILIDDVAGLEAVFGTNKNVKIVITTIG